jgi:hypothetical protein
LSGVEFHFAKLPSSALRAEPSLRGAKRNDIGISTSQAISRLKSGIAPEQAGCPGVNENEASCVLPRSCSILPANHRQNASTSQTAIDCRFDPFTTFMVHRLRRLRTKVRHRFNLCNLWTNFLNLLTLINEQNINIFHAMKCRKAYYSLADDRGEYYGKND